MEMTEDTRASTHSDGGDRERATIYSTRLNCGAYLITLLNAGVWLAEHLGTGPHRRRLIEIQLHPVGSPWMRWVRALFDLSSLPDKVHRFASSRGLIPFANERGSPADHRGPTIIDLVQIQSSSVRIQVDEALAISIERIKVGYAKSAWPTIRAWFIAIRYWRACQENGRLNVQALLRLRYREVLVGDLIASETIKRIPSAGGSLRHCGSVILFGCLVDVVYTVDYILGRNWSVRGSEYVATSETTYLEELYRRTLSLHGVGALELNDYSGQLRILAPGEELPNPFVVRAREAGALSTHQRNRTKQYLAERVSNASRHLWYMFVGHNEGEQGRVVDERGHVVARDDQSLTVVIFLHGFDDAQYMFGLDGFEDLYEWTLVTIDECLGNGQIGRVLIKEHPNIDLVPFSADKCAVKRLRHRYQNEPSVAFINRKTDINALAALGLVYGITHHGSVAEELVAVGLPVIASSIAPWRNNYPFSRLWDSPSEYVALLRGLRAADWHAPDSREMEALLQYVYEYRLNILPGEDLPVSVQWMKWDDNTLDILNGDITAKEERRIAELKPDSPQLIDWLRERAEYYRYGNLSRSTDSQDERIA